jgi:hypothetical protein
MKMGKNKTYKSLMTLDEAILLIDGTFDGYYERMKYSRRGDKKLYPKSTMRADKKALIEKIREWEYKAGLLGYMNPENIEKIESEYQESRKEDDERIELILSDVR